MVAYNRHYDCSEDRGVVPEFKTHQEITWAIGHDPVPRHVVCAANRYGTTIIAGARHHDSIMRSAIAFIGGGDFRVGYEKLLEEAGEREQQGFIDQYGVFMSREEAAYIVVQNKQPLRDSKIVSRELYSENIY